MGDRADEPARHGGVPIDRGWAWCVCFGTFLVILLTSGTSRASGLLFKEIKDTFESNNEEASWFMTVFIVCIVVTSPIANALSQKSSARRVVFFGGLLSMIGSTGSAFATTLPVFVFVFSGFVGCGFGFCFTPAIAIATQYFSQRRSLAMGLAMSGGGFGAFVLPPLVAFFIDRFAFRGCLFLLGAIFGHFCLAATLLRPHSFWGAPAAPPAPKSRPRAHGAARFALLLRSPLLRSPALYLRGIPLALFTDVLPYSYMMLPGLCFEVGFSIQQVTLVLLVMGVPDILGRLGMGWLADKGWIARSHLLALVMALQVVAWVAVSLMPSLVSIFVFVVVLGFLGGGVMTLMAPVMADAVGVGNINSALAFIMIAKIVFFAVPLLLGTIKDKSGTWTWSFRGLAVLLALVEVVLLLDNCFTKKKGPRTEQRPMMRAEGDRNPEEEEEEEV